MRKLAAATFELSKLMGLSIDGLRNLASSLLNSAAIVSTHLGMGFNGIEMGMSV